MVRNISNGETTLDVLKRKSLRNHSLIPSVPDLLSLSSSSAIPPTLPSYIWFPRALFSDSEAACLPVTFHGVVLPVEPGEKLYDLGKENNWARWRALAKGGYGLGEPQFQSWEDQYAPYFFHMV